MKGFDIMPLAHKLRPTKINEVLGQDHLTNENGFLTNMIEKQKPLSIILHGKPGTGKTTLANILMESFNVESYRFNASTDNKQLLKDIIDTTHYTNIILAIDEIHRMKKDVQDYLLPFIENGKVILIGMTTEYGNPFTRSSFRS